MILLIALKAYDVMVPPAVRKRVVVTGLGLCTPLGCGVELVWKKLLQGLSGIQALPAETPGFRALPCKVGGMVPEGTNTAEGQFNPSDHVHPSELRTMSRDSVYSLGVAREALRHAGWMPEDRKRQEVEGEGEDEGTGVSMGNGGTSAIPDYVEAHELITSGRYRKISPYLIPRLLPNSPAGQLSIRYRLKGPNHCVSTACASGLHSIGDSAHMIARGACQVMLAGSSDFSLNPVVLAGFCRAKALATGFNAEPWRASRPFDSRREGFVPSEGAGLVVLEELEHARHREAEIHAEILGYGMSSDAHHITAPSQDGGGAVRAMRAALRDAGMELERVGHINAHATSTPLGDLAESNAIKQAFGKTAQEMTVYAPKGALGHLLGAAGTVETIIAILSVREGQVPPNLNLEERTSEFDLNYVTGGSCEWGRGKGGQPRVAITNSFGFGGTNTSLCIGEYVP